MSGAAQSLSCSRRKQSIEQKKVQGNAEEAATLPFLEMHQQQNRAEKEEQKSTNNTHCNLHPPTLTINNTS